MVTSRIRLFSMLVVLGGISSGYCAGNVFEPSYGAYGQVILQHVSDAGQVDIQLLWGFGIQEDKRGRWKMELHTKYPSDKFPLTANEYISYDGTNIYSILYSPDRVITDPNGAPAKLGPGNNQHAARVSAGPYPLDYTAVGGILWLSFLGGRYLDTNSNQLPLPDLTEAFPRRNPTCWSCDFQYKLMPSAYRPLVSFGTFALNKEYLAPRLVDGRYRQMDEAATEIEFEQLADLLKRLPTLDTNLLVRSLYQVDETNVFNGVVIPTKSHCNVFPLDGSKASNHIEIAVTNLVAVMASEMLPDLEGIVTVEDQRLRISEEHSWRRAVLYNLNKTGWIIDTNDPRIIAATSSQPPRIRIFAAKRPRYYRWSVVFFVSLLLLPPILFAIRYGKSKRTLPKVK